MDLKDRVFSRRNLVAQFFGTGSNHTTAIVVIVVCATAGTFILYCLFRFFRHSWARGSTPLPPMQPVACHREQRLTEFVERSTIYHQPSYLSPPLKLSSATSDSSSLRVTEETFPSRRSSLYTAERGDIQDAQPPPTEDEVVPRTLDAVSGHARHLSNSSLGSLPSVPPSTSPSQVTLPHPYSHRVTSGVSRTSIRTVRSSWRSTIVGLPHGPHSQVNIILPSPLAPSLYPYMSRPEAGRLGVNSSHMSGRASLVDMWTPSLHRSVSFDHIGQDVPTIPGTRCHRASPSSTRRRTSSSPYHSSSSSPPAVPPIPTHR